QHTVAAVDRLPGSALDRKLSSHPGEHQGVDVPEPQQAIQLGPGQGAHPHRSGGGVGEERGRDVHLRAPGTPGPPDVNDQETMAPGGGEHLGSGLHGGASDGWPVRLAMAGPVTLRVDAVVLKVEGQQRRSDWVQLVHRDGLRLSRLSVRYVVASPQQSIEAPVVGVYRENFYLAEARL